MKINQSSLQPTPVGAFRFNTDSSKLEYYDGNQWVNITTDSPENHTGGARMFFAGGTNGSSVVDVIQYVNIPTTGNAIDFGNLIAAEQEGASCSSRTRGFYFGGDPADNDIEYITFSSTGNATDFGNLTESGKSGAGCSDKTRGIMMLGGVTLNTINYISMATTGDAQDFGDMTSGGSAGAGCDSPTRGVIAVGSIDAGQYSNIIEYLTISSTGNSADFGDLSAAFIHRNGYSNAVRGVFHSGYQYPASPNFNNSIEYVTIATLGNTVDFGDSFLGGFGAGGSSPTRGVAGGGYYANSPTGESGGFTNIIDYTQIMTTGNSQDFGDLTNVVRHIKGDSNGHGGLA